MVEVIEFVKLFAVLAGSFAAVYGVTKWRTERNVSLAEDMLALFYRIRDEVKAIRSPASWSGELDEQREPKDAETFSETRARDVMHLIDGRYRKAQELFSQFRVLKYRAAVAFGKEWRAPFESVDRVMGKIFRATHMLVVTKWGTDEAGLIADDTDRREKLDEWQRTLWDGWDEENDPINTELDDLQAQFERLVKESAGVRSVARKSLQGVMDN